MPKQKPQENRKMSIVPGSLKEAGSNIVLSDAPANDTVDDVTISLKRRNLLLASPPPSGETPQQRKANYAADYGADPTALAKVEEFVKQHGLTILKSSLAERQVVAKGTVGQMNEAFGVKLKIMRQPGGEKFRGRTGVIKVPEELEGIVEGVFGLDERPFATTHFRAFGGLSQRVSFGTVGALPGFSPTDIAKIYNFPPGLIGTGQTIGIIELGGGFRPSELQTYFQKVGVSPQPSVVEGTHPVGGQNRPGTDPFNPANADVEVMLDIEVAGAVARGAQIVVYFAPDASDQSFIDVMTAAVHDPNHDLSIISISWGGPEAAATDQFQRRFHQVLETASYLDITVCAAAGDDGSADFPFNDPHRPWDGHAHVDYPASDPLVLACGGTRLIRLVTGSSEVVWHSGKNVGTGGGVSRIFDLPDYQANARVPNANNPPGPVKRGVPDVAGDAAQESGYYVLCDKQFFPDPANGVPPVGGTSAVAPLWAGLVALLNQGLSRRLGFLNPLLYRLPSSSGAFNDVTVGNNGDYQAEKGWDACTGLGTPNGQKLLAALAAPAEGAPVQPAFTEPSPPPPPLGSDHTELFSQYLRVTEKVLDLFGSCNPAASIAARRTSGGGGLSFGAILASLKQAIFGKTNFFPSDDDDPRTIVGNDDVLLQLIDDTFFQGFRRFPASGLDGNDTITKLALAIQFALNN